MIKPSIQSITVRNLVTFLLVLAIITVFITGVNFRGLSKQAMRDQALAHAELVKSGLTAHMKAGIMDKRDYYLEEIMRLHKVNMLHVIRGAPIIAQYGGGSSLEGTFDAVTKQAFETKQPVFILDEFTLRPTVRAIIPYIATREGKLNCLGCHQVTEGTVLGAVDIELDVSDYQRRSLLVLAGLTAASVIFLILIAVNTSHTIRRHVQSPLDILIERAKVAYRKHSPVNPDIFTTKEITHVANEINLFNSKVIAHRDLLRKKNKELMALNHEIEGTLRETVYAMGVIEEQRSRETHNHTKRVTLFCQLLAKGLGLSDAEIDMVCAASPLHDIGKLGIPDDINLKSDKLTDEEFQIMQNHTRIGYAMLKHSTRDILRAAAIIALQHHEKWDGSGYPQGLEGEEIHVYARIVALADVFDALYSPRIYKGPWELQRTADWITEQRGRHFDPAVVDVFVDCVDDFAAIHDHYSYDTDTDYEDLSFIAQ
jgi:response regulator RpfG family c-di-GMP phosphodiesterase